MSINISPSDIHELLKHLPGYTGEARTRDYQFTFWRSLDAAADAQRALAYYRKKIAAVDQCEDGRWILVG